jgi:hypothetical protein
MKSLHLGGDVARKFQASWGVAKPAKPAKPGLAIRNPWRAIRKIRLRVAYDATRPPPHARAKGVLVGLVLAPSNPSNSIAAPQDQSPITLAAPHPTFAIARVVA